MSKFLDLFSSYYRFKDEELLKLALTHRSSKTQITHSQFSQKTDNEQLEFFGDAFLNLVIAEELLHLFPGDDEGLLSKKRAHIVDQRTLGERALELGLEEALLLGAGEREQESHLKPRVLASAVEAIIAAVYFDSDFLTAKKVVLNLLKHNILEVHALSFDKDFKTQLQELTQQKKLGLPVYRELSAQGPSHDPLFLISLEINSEEMARATGSSKKRAEQLAAEQVFKQLTSQLKK